MQMPWTKEKEGAQHEAMEPASMHTQINPPSPTEIRKLWMDGERETISQRRSYYLSRAFTDGDQWVEWNGNSGTARIMDFRSVDERETRATMNKIRQRRRGLIARLIPSALTFEVRASGADTIAMARQLTQEQILEASHKDLDWETPRRENIGQAIDGGVAGLAFELDPEGGTVVGYDPASGRQVRMPKVRVTALAISEFTLEPGSRSVQDALWWMRRTTLTPKQAQKKYDLPKPPVADAQAQSNPTAARLHSARGYAAQTNLCSVYVYFQRPTDDDPGLICHVIGNEVVFCEPWPFAFQELNIRLTHETPWDGDWRGSTLMDDARQIQATYNYERTVIGRHAYLAANARILSPAGALDDLNVFTDEPGEVVEYNDDGTGAKPGWMEPPEISRWLANDGPSLETMLDDVFSSNEVSRGQAPGDRNSGLALSILAEKGDLPLSLMGQAQARAWAQIGRWTLQSIRKLLKEYADQGAPVQGKVVLTDETTSTAYEVKYTFEDIDEVPNVHVPIEATTPRSHAAAQAAVADLARTFPQLFQAMSPDQIANMLRLPNPKDFLSTINTDVRLAKYENLMIRQGEPMWPDEFNDHAAHRPIHKDQMNSPEFETWPPELQDLLIRHEKQHEMFENQARQEMAMQVEQAQQGQLPQGGTVPPGLPPASAIDVQSTEGPMQ